MSWIVWTIIALFVLGTGIALYEWRKKTVVLRHDFNKAPSGDLAGQRIGSISEGTQEGVNGFGGHI